MKSWIVLFFSFFFAIACAQTTFHVVELKDGKVANLKSKKEDIGLVYYQPVPYLLVQRPLNKDGATTSKIIYLPDRENPMSMRFKGGFGSAEMSVTLTNGMIATFNQSSDSKIPELLANLASPVSGVADAAASFATAGLTQAQEDAIRDGLNDESEDEELVPDIATMEVGNPPSRCDPNSAAWIQIPVPANSEIALKEQRRLIAAANTFACQSERLMKQSLQKQADDALKAAEQITYILSKAYEDDETKIWIQRLLGKHPIATPLRVIVKDYKDPKLGDSDALTEIEDKLKLAYSVVSSVSNRIDPPKPAKPKEPFELYKIVVKGERVWLVRANKASADAISAFLNDAGSDSQDQAQNKSEDAAKDSPKNKESKEEPVAFTEG